MSEDRPTPPGVVPSHIKCAEHDGKLQNLEGTNLRIVSELTTIRQLLKRLEEVIFIGNGRESLLTRMSGLENKMEEVLWFKRLVLTALITNVAAVLVAVFLSLR